MGEKLEHELEEFKKSVDRLFEVDFAVHQENVFNFYANYRAFVRYNNLIFDIERISKRSFWEWHQHWIDIGSFFLATLVFNVILYGGAKWKMRRDLEKDEREEKEIQKRYFQYLLDQKDREEMKMD